MELDRRRAPGWVRSTKSTSLHGLVWRLARQRAVEGVSEAQEWLWDACISELTYRRRQARWPERSCACELCCGPFDFGD